MAYFNLQHIFPGKPMRVRRSATGKGFHVIVYGTKVTREQNLALRELLGDDPAHIKIDRETLEGQVHKPFQLLWTNKDGQPVDEVEPLAEPWKLVKVKVRHERR